MGDRRHVADRRDVEADGSQSAERRFTARTGALNFDFQRLHAVFLGLLASVFGGHLGGEGRGFPRAFEAHGAGRRPGNRVALHVGDQDLGVVERRVHVSNASGDVLALFALHAGLVASHIVVPPLLFLAGGAGHGSSRGPSGA